MYSASRMRKRSSRSLTLAAKVAATVGGTVHGAIVGVAAAAHQHLLQPVVAEAQS
jgi:hypothetical protein